MCFYPTRANALPAKFTWPREYDGNLFVALFGQAEGLGPEARAGRGELERGRQVVRCVLEGSSDRLRVTAASVFLSYEGEDSECPVDLAVSPTGDMYLLTFPVPPSKTLLSKIYRIRYVGNNALQRAAPEP